MAHQLLIDNKNGNVWDLSGVVTEVSYKTALIGKPSSLEFTFIKDGLYESKDFQINMGDIVSYKADKKKVFYGYVFSINSGQSKEVKVKAYDQIRYLMKPDTKRFVGKTASQIVKQLGNELKLKLGNIEDTGYKIPKVLHDNKTYIDMISDALDRTLINYLTNFMLYDDFGSINLTNTSKLQYDKIIGQGSLMTDYTFDRSIDSDTYNQIKLYKDNKETGKREIYIAKDSGSIKDWGLLQLYQSVDEGMNEAQIKVMLENLLTTKNRETKKISIEAIGDFNLRAGYYAHIDIPELMLQRYMLISECEQKVSGDIHTMKLDLVVI